MKQELGSVIRDYPYNSFGKIYLAEGKEYPEFFGGNCVFLTQKLIQQLRSSGYAPYCIYAENRVHFATMCHESGKAHYLDPFLLHDEPIPIAKLMREVRSATYNAYPIVDGNSSKLRVTPQGKHNFSVSTFGWRGGSYQHIREYEYDIRKTLQEVPQNWEQGRDNTDSSYLTLRTLDPDNSITSMYLYPEGNMNATVPGKRKLKQKNDPEFYDLTSRIAEQLHTDVARLLNFFYDAQKIYKERAQRAAVQPTCDAQ